MIEVQGSLILSTGEWQRITVTALNTDGKELPPRKGTTAICQECGQPVRAKCSSIVIPHWAHFPVNDTDSFSEGEAAWHRGLLMQYKEER